MYEQLDNIEVPKSIKSPSQLKVFFRRVAFGFLLAMAPAAISCGPSIPCRGVRAGSVNTPKSSEQISYKVDDPKNAKIKGIKAATEKLDIGFSDFRKQYDFEIEDQGNGKWLIRYRKKGMKVEPEPEAEKVSGILLDSESRALWIEVNDLKIKHLREHFKHYEKRYGKRDDFDEIKKAVIAEIKKIMAKNKELKKNKPIYRTFSVTGSIDLLARSHARKTIRSVAEEIELLSREEASRERREFIRDTFNAKKREKAEETPLLTPEDRKKMIKENEMIIHFLKEKYKEYKKKYGKRKSFDAFRKSVANEVRQLEKENEDLKSGRIKRGFMAYEPTEKKARTEANLLIMAAEMNANLLKPYENLNEALAERNEERELKRKKQEELQRAVREKRDQNPKLSEMAKKNIEFNERYIHHLRTKYKYYEKMYKKDENFKKFKKSIAELIRIYLESIKEIKNGGGGLRKFPPNANIDQLAYERAEGHLKDGISDLTYAIESPTELTLNIKKHIELLERTMYHLRVNYKEYEKKHGEKENFKAFKSEMIEQLKGYLKRIKKLKSGESEPTTAMAAMLGDSIDKTAAKTAKKMLARLAEDSGLFAVDEEPEKISLSREAKKAIEFYEGVIHHLRTFYPETQKRYGKGPKFNVFKKNLKDTIRNLTKVNEGLKDGVVNPEAIDTSKDPKNIALGVLDQLLIESEVIVHRGKKRLPRKRMAPPPPPEEKKPERRKVEKKSQVRDFSELSLSDLESVIHSEKLVLIKFNLVGCGPCNAYARTLKKVKPRVGNQVLIVQLTIEKNPQYNAIVKRLGNPTVTSFPSTLAIRNGEVLFLHKGTLSEEQLMDAFSQLGIKELRGV